eukprot:CFRG5287T1
MVVKTVGDIDVGGDYIRSRLHGSKTCELLNTQNVNFDLRVGIEGDYDHCDNVNVDYFQYKLTPSTTKILSSMQ